MWKRYRVVLQMNDKFAAAIPKNPKEIKNLLLNRMLSKPPPDVTLINELAEQASKQVEAEEEAVG